MSKRKYGEDGEDPSSSGTSKVAKPNPTATTRARNVIADGEVQLTKALNLAGAFERQKLGRRLKDANDKGSTKYVSQIHDEMRALRRLDMTFEATHHICKTIMKIKSLRESPSLPEEVNRGAKLQKPPDPPTVNVRSRVYKSTRTQSCMAPLVELLRKILAPSTVGKSKRKAENKKMIDNDKKGVVQQEKSQDLAKKSDKGSPQPERGLYRADFEDNVEVGEDEENEKALKRNTSPAEDSEDAEVERYGISRSEWQDIKDEDLSGSEVFAELDEAVAGDSAESEDEDDTDRARESSFPPLNQEAGKATSVLEPESDGRLRSAHNPNLTVSVSPSPEPVARPAKAEKTVIAPKASDTSKQKQTPNTTTSSFLPTLTTSGYISGSDEDDPYLDDEAAAPPVRKNRRGQRARQAIWEKKFGEQANHVRKWEGKAPLSKPAKGTVRRGKTKDDRDQGWDPVRGAVGSSEENGGSKGKKGGFVPAWMRDRQSRKGGADESAASGGNAIEIGQDWREKKEKAQPTEPKAMHPSWVAAKQAKAKAEASHMGQFQGQKVKFD